MRAFLLGLLVLISASSFSQQVARSMTSSAGLFVGFYDFRPPGYVASNTAKKYPLIIFLHGIGERGNGTTDLPNVCANGIPRNIYWGSTMTFTVNGTTESFLVLSPQLDTKYGGWVNGYVDAMMEYAKANLNYDPDRVYLTGLSAGGGGTWDYVSSQAGNAGIFAAIAPVCGSSYTASGMCYIAQAHLPVWAFHAVDDGTVPVSMTQNAVALINSCSPAPNPAPITTYYPAGLGGHGIWYMSYDETHTYANPNLYEWFLSKRRSTNGNGVNQAPVVQLPNDISLVLPTNSTTLDASKSYDFDGTVSSYRWTQVSGPGTATISSPSSATTSVSNLVEGTYVFQVTITDDKGATSTGQLRVLEQSTYGADVAPVCKAGDDFTSTNSTVYLSGAGSYDPDGSIASYQWSQIAGPVTATIKDGTTAFPTISNLITGNYKFRLVVTDNMGKPSDDTVAFSISTNAVVNVPPTASISGTTNITLPTNFTTLDGSGSYDPNGSISSYQWSQVSGPNSATFGSATAKSTAVSGLVAGTYSFQLAVTDNLGSTGTTTVSVVVNAAVGNNKPPIANAGNDFTTQYKDYAYLSGGASYDPDGSIATWAWTQVSGPNTATILGGNTMFPTVQNLIGGTYTFKLTVTDNLGASASANVNVTLGSNGKPPVANAGNDFSTTNNYAYLSGGASYDPDGSITGWAWSQVSGPNTATILAANGMFPTVQNLISGSYTFRVTVTDNSGLSASDDVVLTVGAKVAGVAGSLSTMALSTDVNAGSTKVNDLSKEPGIFPNPATNQITVTFTNDFVGNYKFVVLDVKGKIVTQYNYSKQAGQVQQQVDISKLPAGMYYLETIYEGNQKAVTKKFVKL
jgi:hypothetical protein